jgi:hypothetical protein
MEKNSVLFLVTCSNTKEIGGINKYIPNTSIQNFLPIKLANSIYDCRKNSYNLIKTHQITRFGHRISEDDYNKHLFIGRDISFQDDESTDTLYLPAIQRYSGRIYSALGKDRYKLVNQSQSHLLIISGLYGVLNPDEMIQLYSLNVNDSPEVWKNWTRYDILTSALLEYIKNNNIKHLVNFLSVRSYSQLINWDRLSNEKNIYVYHPFSTQFTGDTFHPNLGKYLRFFLKCEENKIIKMLGEGMIKRRFLVDLYLEPSLVPMNENLLIESNEFSMIERILRMEFNIRLIMQYHEIKRSDRTSEMVWEFYNKYGNENLRKGLLRKFLDKRNEVVHELRILLPEEWKEAADTYFEFITFCDETIKPLNKFMLCPID